MNPLVVAISVLLDAEVAFIEARRVYESLGARMPTSHDAALVWFDDRIEADKQLIIAARVYRAALKNVLEVDNGHA
jgi:hypothetical protein